jgi:hypothetical protein
MHVYNLILPLTCVVGQANSHGGCLAFLALSYFVYSEFFPYLSLIYTLYCHRKSSSCMPCYFIFVSAFCRLCCIAFLLYSAFAHLREVFVGSSSVSLRFMKTSCGPLPCNWLCNTLPSYHNNTILQRMQTGAQKRVSVCQSSKVSTTCTQNQRINKFTKPWYA